MFNYQQIYCFQVLYFSVAMVENTDCSNEKGTQLT